METGEEPAREAISHARDPRCPVPDSQPGGLLNWGRSPARPGPVGCTDAGEVAEACGLEAAPAFDIDPRAIASRDHGLGVETSPRRAWDQPNQSDKAESVR